MDKRTDRIQTIKLKPKFFPLDIHKSMFINDLMITIPQYYVESWGKDILNKHTRENRNWEIEFQYETPKDFNQKKLKFKGTLSLFFSDQRKQTSSYRLKWDNQFAIQLAKDYAKSFVRSLEFHIGDEYYKSKRYTEYDIGGFKEQLQVKIEWIDNLPHIRINEFFRVREDSQEFPHVYKELSSYLIADYLLSDEKEILRRIQVSQWKNRDNIKNELNENNIYILLNRQEKEIYFGETRNSLSKRYPEKVKHHTFENWTEYCVIQLPPETSDHSRILIERVLIAVGYKLFLNNFGAENPIFDIENIFKLMNKKK